MVFEWGRLESNGVDVVTWRAMSPDVKNSLNKFHQQVLSAEGGFQIFFPLYNTIFLSTFNFSL